MKLPGAAPKFLSLVAFALCLADWSIDAQRRAYASRARTRLPISLLRHYYHEVKAFDTVALSIK